MSFHFSKTIAHLFSVLIKGRIYDVTSMAQIWKASKILKSNGYYEEIIGKPEKDKLSRNIYLKWLSQMISMKISSSLEKLLLRRAIRMIIWRYVLDW